MDTSQDQRPPRLGRQGCYRLRQPPQGVPVGGNLLGRRRIIRRHGLLSIIQDLKGDDPRTSHMPNDKRACSLEQVGPRMPNVVDPIAGRQQTIGLLDQIIGIKPNNPPPRQPCAQGRFMRQDLAQQPTRPILFKMMVHSPGLPPHGVAP